MRDVCAIILAAGKGTRMGEGAPKALRELLGKPLVIWSIELIENLGIKDIYVVVGHRSDVVKETITKLGRKVNFIEQTEQLGTAHSLKTALDNLETMPATLLVLFVDDAALYLPETLQKFLNSHISRGNGATVLTHKSNKAFQIGGLKRDKNGRLVGVLSPRQIKEFKMKEIDVLCGAFCFSKDWITKYLSLVEKNPLSGEYPLPKIIELSAKNNENVISFELEDDRQWNSVNTPDELAEAEKKKGKLIN